MVCLSCTATGERVCLAAEGFGNRHCFLENIADKVYIFFILLGLKVIHVLCRIFLQIYPNVYLLLNKRCQFVLFKNWLQLLEMKL